MSGVEVKEGHRVVGPDLARHDAIEKVAGRTVYAADFALPGMLHARLKRSDFAHARLTRIDTAAAEAIARNPSATGDIRGALILGLVLIESLVIYVLLISLILFFLPPFGSGQWGA